MKYLVLGASASAINGVKELRKNDKDATIVMVSKDQKIYSRCILHHYLSEQRTIEQLSFVEDDFEEIYQVEWIKGRAAISMDVIQKEVILDDCTTIRYDKVLIATGARSTFPPIKNMIDAKHIYGLRNLEDIEIIKKESKSANNIVVLGAGLVGMDVVVGLVESGAKNVTLVETTDRLLNKQLDKRASGTYERALTDHGVKLIFSTFAECVNYNDARVIESVLLSTGETIPCDLLIVAAGVKPNIEFLEGCGVLIDQFGIVVDETGRTTSEDVYAAGDVTGRGPIWPVAVKEGIIAANNMTGGNARMDDFFYYKSTMSFFGIHTMSIGINELTEDDMVEELYDVDGVYKRIILKDGIITGAILQGDLSYGGILTRLVSNKIDITKVKKPVFKIDYSDFFHIDQNAEYYYNV